MRKIPLQFSDIDFGTEEFGFIPVEPGEDPDDADRRYERHLAAQGVTATVDPMGNLVVEAPRRPGTLRLTEGQLRQIIRQEVRALTEMPHNPERSAWRGRSYRKGGQLVRNLRDAVVDNDDDGLEVFTITLPNADGLGADLGLHEGALGFVKWLREVGAKHRVRFGPDAYDPNTDTVQGSGAQAGLMALAAELDRTPGLNDFLGGHGASFKDYISSGDPDENRQNFQY